MFFISMKKLNDSGGGTAVGSVFGNKPTSQRTDALPLVYHLLFA